MKKKLKIDQLKVQSFITSADPVQGGGTLCNCDPRPDLQTAYSCYAFITCDVVGCAVNSRYAFCDTGNATHQVSLAMSDCPL